LAPGPIGQGVDHVLDVDPAPLHRVRELVEHVELVPFGLDASFDLGPSLGRVGGVVVLGAALAAPRPARAHLVPLDRAALAGLVVQAGETLEDCLLADAPLRRLHELEDADVPALVPAAHGQAERGGGLPFAVTGVDHQQRPVAALARREPVVGDDERLALRHQATPRRGAVAAWTTPVIPSAVTSPSGTCSACRWVARSAP